MSNETIRSCSQLWDFERARISLECLPLVCLVPALVASLIGIGLLSSPILDYRPLWLRTFARETANESIDYGTSPFVRKTWTHWTLFLIAVSVSGLVISVVSSLALSRSQLAVFEVVPWLIATLIAVINRPTSTSIPLLMLYVPYSLVQLLELVSAEHLPSIRTNCAICKLVLSLAAVLVILVMPMRNVSLKTTDIGSSKQDPSSDFRSPEDNISLWQWMTASWMAPIIRKGNSGRMDEDHVWHLPFEFQHTKLHALFRDLKGSVLRRLITANGLDLIIIVNLAVFESLLRFSSPVLLQQLLRSIEAESTQKAITYAIIIGVVRLTKAQSEVFSLWFGRRAYERSRGEMITMLYEKTLNRKAFHSPTEKDEDEEDEDATKPGEPKSRFHRIVASISRRLRLGVLRRLLRIQSEAQQTKGPASTGKILNLMKNDVYEVSQRFWEFNGLIEEPLALILSALLIWQLLGPSCFLGIACVVVAQLINLVLIKVSVHLEKIRRIITDTRLSVSSQYIESIRHLRWYDWQGSWLTRILDARRSELQLRVVTGLWRNAISLSNALASALFPVVAFAAYTLIAKKPLTVDVAFPALSLFSSLDRALRDIPELITVLINASVALGRINDFMAEPDREEINLGPRSADLRICFEDASFSWPGSEQPVLVNVHATFTPGLTVILGRVGQGKSALLQAMLGELDQISGTVSRPDEMFGYCAQTPWLQSMSIRDNILFTSPYDEQRYKQTLDVCALVPDLVSFKHGDLSNIGENGIGLSGGQKARVALARAVYSQAKILLLDDPLAALDHDTASQIVSKLFQGSLFDGRMVILVTHRVDLVVHLADAIFEVHESSVKSIDVASIESHAQGNGAVAVSKDEDSTNQKESNGDELAIPDKFIEDEHRADGGVIASVYWRYIKAGSLKWWVIFVLFVLIQRLFRIADYLFLKEWGEAYGRSTSSANPVSGLLDKLPAPEDDVKPWLFVYLGIAISKTLSNTLLEIVLIVIIYIAGRTLFGDVLRRVSGAKFRFYDTTPVGRLMNRLTSDFSTLDGGLGHQLENIAWCGVSWLSSMIIIASTTPVFLLFSALLTFLFVRLFLQFLPTSQSLRRLEMVSLTPLMTNFGILLEGLATVRAFKAQSQFQGKIINVVDTFQRMDHFYWSLQTWLMFRFDTMAAFSTLFMTLLALYEGLSPGLTAFVLSTAANFVNNTHYLCRLYGQIQMEFVSVERVIELLDLDQEDIGSVQPPAAWPSYKDDVIFDNVTLKYAENLPPALEEVTFHIPGGSTTAIIGRTGSGKSTLALALLATIRPEAGGSIRIGSMDLSTVDVHALRQRVTFVAQDPVLFPGTLRQNLDPTNTYTDAECEAVLQRVLGTTHIVEESTPSSSSSSTLPSQLSTGAGEGAVAGAGTGAIPDLTLATPISTGGRNLSQGQRQLLGLGRAILRRSPVVILDEATASIDGTTAIEMQRVLREELKESTVIMIAHRVEAVRAANWAVALEKGRVVMAGPADEVIARRFTEA